MRKFLSFMVVVAVAAMAVAGIASAGSNYANGTTISGTSSNASLGGIITCTSSVSGPLTNLSPGATVLITSASFTPCSPSGSSVTTCNLPSPGWDLTTTSTTDDNVWKGSASGVCLTITTFLTGACKYQGSVSGGTYTNSTHTLNLAGGLPLVSGGGACPNPGTISGQYSVSPTDFAINTN